MTITIKSFTLMLLFTDAYQTSPINPLLEYPLTVLRSEFLMPPESFGGFFSFLSLNCLLKYIIKLTTNMTVLLNRGNTGPICHAVIMIWTYFTTGLYSLSWRSSYRKISWSLEAARSDVIMIFSFCNSAGISAALLPRCLSNFRMIAKV